MKVIKLKDDVLAFKCAPYKDHTSRLCTWCQGCVFRDTCGFLGFSVRRLIL